MKPKKIYYFLLVIILLVPLGLISSNPAWGEWEKQHYEKILGYVPKNIAKTDGIDAPFGDYTTSFLGDIGSYYFSAVVGVILLFGIFIVLQKVIKIEKSKR